MEIQVNDQPLHFTLESELTLGEVVRGLEDWLKGSDLVLYSVKHGDRELLNCPAGEWAGKPHSEVDRLIVTVKPAQELRILNLKTVTEFLEMLQRCLSAPNPRLMEQLAGGFPLMVESVQRQLPDPDEGGASELSALAGLFAGFQAQDARAWTQEARLQAQELSENLKARVGRRLQELEQPGAALRSLAGALKGCIEEISEVSILLQGGKDRQAMAAIIRFSELSQSLVRLLSALKDEPESRRPELGGKSLEEFYREMNGVLKELVDAFSLKDTVLIGDLMEYEIAPRLEQLRGFLEAVA